MINATCHSLFADILHEAGFRLGRVSKLETAFAFTRLREDQTYELIRCNFAGKMKEAAVCRIGSSITRIVEFKGLTENQVLLDIAQEKDRGWTIIRDIEQLEVWARLVMTVGVPRVRRFANSIAEKLLDRTKFVRSKALQCFTEVMSLGTPKEAYRRLIDSSAKAEMDLARRLSEWPGVMQIPHSEFEYLLACLSVLKIIRRHNLPNPSNIKEMPLEDTQLMWHIQLIADKLIDQRLYASV